MIAAVRRWIMKKMTLVIAVLFAVGGVAYAAWKARGEQAG